MRLALPVLVGLLQVACIPDDYDGTGPAATPPPTGAPHTGVVVDGDIVGDWVSAGADLSDLFAEPPFEYERVDATFRSDGGYLVAVVDQQGTTAEVAGTYTVDTSTSPAAIILTQSSPYEATAEGIWAVTDGLLLYEVVQTVPDYGFFPPTPAGGFGSTGGPNMTAGINVQTYR